MSNIQASGILEFGLSTILPAGSILTLNVDEPIVSITRNGHITKQAKLNDHQIKLLLPLLNAFPGFVPYDEMLLSLFPTYDEMICRMHLASNADRALRPVRDMLKRINEKLALLGVEVAAVHDNGFILIRHVEQGESTH